MTIREAFAVQSRYCATLGSPFMGKLMALLGFRLEPGNPVADRVLNWAGDPSSIVDSVPLRLAGALHALRIEGLALTDVYPPASVDNDVLWSAIRDAFDAHTLRILHWLDSPPQTNEVCRSSVIIPALSAIHRRYGLPVDLIELGTSGGLNLRANRFRLDLPSGLSIGPEDALVVLKPEWRGNLPATDLPTVLARIGVDLAPIDPCSAEGRLKLLAYLWPDQPDRLERTDAAIAEAAATPAETAAGDAGAWLEEVLDVPADDRLRVVFHTIAWQYFPEATAQRALTAMAAVPGPLVRLAMEADGGEGAGVSLTHYPSGEVEVLGRADFHGRWVDWQD